MLPEKGKHFLVALQQSRLVGKDEAPQDVFEPVEAAWVIIGFLQLRESRCYFLLLRPLLPWR